MSEPRIVKPDSDAEWLTAEGCHILESWNSPDDAAVSIARARVAPGVTTRRHRLEAVQERYLIVSGRGRVEVEDLDPAEVGPGDVVIIPPRAVQRITNTGATDLIFYAICSPRFTPECYEDVDSD